MATSRTLSFCVFLALPLAIEAAAFDILGRTIDVRLPAGYCETQRHPTTSGLIDSVQQAIGNSNEIVAIFANCEELKDLEEGHRPKLDHFGQVLIVRLKGKVQEIEGISRTDYIRELSARAPSFPNALKAAETRAKEFIPGYSGAQSLGLLDTDSSGMYVGITMSLDDETGHPRQLIGVISSTLVRQLPVSINLYQPYTSSADLKNLLQLSKSTMARFVDANE